MPPPSLNILQQLTRQWDALHPHNAAQAVRLAGDADIPAASAALSKMLRDLAVGFAQVNGRHFSIDAPPNDATVPLLQLPPDQSIDEFITEQLNTPFNPSGGAFIRPFLARDGNTHWLGIVSHHWAADGQAVRMLLREWVVRLLEPTRARRHPAAPAAGGYWHYFGPEAASWSELGGVLEAIRNSSRFRSVRRIDASAGADLRCDFSRHDLPDGVAPRLRAAARRRGATLADIFLAVLAQAADRLVIARPTHRRHALALGSIVDLRPRSRELATADVADSFGLFLGFTSVILRPRDLDDTDRLVSRISSQSRHNNRIKAAQMSMIRLAGAVAAGRFLSTPSLLETYRKRLPLAAAVSNVNLVGGWIAHRYHGKVIEYMRRPNPISPMFPLVLTPTTLGEKSHFTLTCRSSVLNAAAQSDLAELIRNRLIHIAGA